MMCEKNRSLPTWSTVDNDFVRPKGIWVSHEHEKLEEILVEWLDKHILNAGREYACPT